MRKKINFYKYWKKYWGLRYGVYFDCLALLLFIAALIVEHNMIRY